MHSYHSNLQHVIFGTKDRLPLLLPELREPVRAYMGGIARKHGMRALASGGVADHVHILLSLPATLDIAKAVQLIKAGSSKWLRETYRARFRWQEGYASFSVSQSQADRVRDYIRNQEQHHRRRDFKQELQALLRRHGIAFEPDDLDT